jgi:hypothetical protein
MLDLLVLYAQPIPILMEVILQLLCARLVRPTPSPLLVPTLVEFVLLVLRRTAVEYVLAVQLVLSLLLMACRVSRVAAVSTTQTAVALLNLINVSVAIVERKQMLARQRAVIVQLVRTQLGLVLLIESLSMALPVLLAKEEAILLLERRSVLHVQAALRKMLMEMAVASVQVVLTVIETAI